VGINFYNAYLERTINQVLLVSVNIPRKRRRSTLKRIRLERRRAREGKRRAAIRRA